MELDYAFFARYAEPAPDGTLVIVGADLGRVVADQFPIVMPSLVVVIKLRPPAPGTVRVKFGMTGPESIGPLFNSGDDWQEVVARKIDNSGACEGTRLVLNLPPFPLPSPGDYKFSLLFDHGIEVPLTLKALEKKEVNS